MGKKHGTMTGWYKNGQKSIEQNWNNNKKNGHHVMWYGNGMKKEEGYLKDGKEVGEWSYFKENGDLDRVLDHN